MGPEREPLSHAEVLGRWVGAFVDELVARGLRDVCFCPGSRSTPLAVAFARHPDVKLWSHLDERSCAYFALGMAKADSTRPVAILCSSGTAAVNFAPAVVEAYHSHVPLVVLTADRPPELQELGANQTINQHALYGPAVKWFSHLPLPEASDHMLRYVRVVADRAVSTAQEAPMGPVHLDFPFREPLMPAPYEFSNRPQRETTAAVGAGRESSHASAIELGGFVPERGVIVCGPNSSVNASSLLALSERLGYPVLADPLSGVRSVKQAPPNLIPSYDAFLHSSRLTERLAPDIILRLGDPPTSKPLATYLQRHRGARQVVVAPPGTWPDPDLTAHEVVHAGATALCEGLLQELDESSQQDSDWLRTWRQAETCARNVIRKALAETDAPSEASAALDLADVIPSGANVFAGNSMPVRDLDSFFATEGKAVRLLGSRGASGIDGVISTALGVSAISNGSSVLLIGDLSFYHDMNGLLAAKRHNLSATIVLINNDGGGIFSFLPQHEQSEHFEELFGTPHRLDFSHVALLYGVDFQRVTTREEYRGALKASFNAPGVQVIEVRTDREENLRLHQRIWDAVAEAVEPLVTAEDRAHDTRRG